MSARRCARPYRHILDPYSAAFGASILGLAPPYASTSQGGHTCARAAFRRTRSESIHRAAPWADYQSRAGKSSATLLASRPPARRSARHRRALLSDRAARHASRRRWLGGRIRGERVHAVGGGCAGRGNRARSGAARRNDRIGHLRSRRRTPAHWPPFSRGRHRQCATALVARLESAVARRTAGLSPRLWAAFRCASCAA